MQTNVPSTRDRFRKAISAGTTLEVAAGVCAAVHKAQVTELVEQIQRFVGLDDMDDFRAEVAEYLD